MQNNSLNILPSKWFKPVNNAPLVVFRIFFGLIFFVESLGAIATGWVKTNLIEPKIYFSFIGFEFLQIFTGNYMYLHFVLLALASLGVMLGYRYRFNIVLLTVLWAMVYLVQKTAYNNHYYFMGLIAFVFCFLPANSRVSFDANKNPSIATREMPRWISLVFIVQISCVYVYAALAKIYPDWLNATISKQMFSSVNWPDFLEPIFTHEIFYYFIAYAGIFFDALIVPALLYKRTRIWALIASVIFHLFNSVVLQIGVFPYFALSFSVFFFKPEVISRIFFFKEKSNSCSKKSFKPRTVIFYLVFVPFLILQITLPLRHYFFKDNVLFTEEGHRLSWRMMLRSRYGSASFKVVDLSNNLLLEFPVNELLTKKQLQSLNAPDVIWQMAQFIKSYYAKENKKVAVYVSESGVSINKKPAQQLIDPRIDLAQESWNPFKHHGWILAYNP